MPQLHVYMRGTRTKTPIVIESNIEWALPYWKRRRRVNKDLYWEIK